MVTTTPDTTEARPPLSTERVLHGAIALADRDGIDALTMRNLASDLGVEAMSLYHHVANKEALLDGVVDTLIQEIAGELGGLEVPAGDIDWRSALRHRILTARRVMLRHPWAPGIIETRTTMIPTLLLYMDGVLGILVRGGFTYDLAHHTMHALGSRALGFNQELFAPSSPADSERSNAALAETAAKIPHIVGMLAEVAHDDPDTTLGWCDDQTEFEFGLDVMLDGLEQRLQQT